MPTLSIFFVRTALVFLALGAASGGLLLVNKATLLDPLVWRLLPLHIEWLLVGWCLQLAMGVGWWILPRLADNTRGSPRLSWASYVALNVGLLTTAAATALAPVTVDLSPVNIVGIAIQMTAVAMFVLAVWPRVGFVPDEIRAHRQRRGKQ